MRGLGVNKELRLVQVFLSTARVPGPGIYEVSSDKSGNLYCTCKDYERRLDCKHTAFVADRLEDNNGTYPIEILSKAPVEEAELALRSNEANRNFIIKYGKIEVF